MTDITIQSQGIDNALASLDGLDDAQKRAASRALNGTIGWLRTRVSKDVADKHDIPVRAVRTHRTYTRRATKSRLQGSVWVGLNPVQSGYLKPLRNAPTKGGASARAHFFRGGFVATMQSGRQSIFSRLGKSRLPIVEERVEIGVPSDYASLEPEIVEQFDKRLDHELNYELNIKPR